MTEALWPKITEATELSLAVFLMILLIAIFFTIAIPSTTVFVDNSFCTLHLSDLGCPRRQAVLRDRHSSVHNTEAERISVWCATPRSKKHMDGDVCLVALSRFTGFSEQCPRPHASFQDLSSIPAARSRAHIAATAALSAMPGPP